MTTADPTSHAMNTAFIQALGPELAAQALAEKAPGMARYMKSTMPYLGVPSPAVRKTVRALAKEHPFESVEQLLATMTELWRSAAHREFRYAAIMLADSRMGRGEIRLLPFYAVVIEEGQWWDYVDSVAPRLWDLLEQHPATVEPLMRDWSRRANFWFRRAAIISQLPAKSSTNLSFLRDVIVENCGDQEFFIRKAIGWALRQYARTDPQWVLAFVAEHEDQLSPLSRREALKHLQG